MKKLFFALIVLLTLSFTGSDSTTVYYCANGKTEVYHMKKDCYSLKRCTYEVNSVTRTEAAEMGLRLCGNED